MPPPAADVLAQLQIAERQLNALKRQLLLLAQGSGPLKPGDTQSVQLALQSAITQQAQVTANADLIDKLALLDTDIEFIRDHYIEAGVSARNEAQLLLRERNAELTGEMEALLVAFIRLWP